jgi:hypothetical protein
VRLVFLSIQAAGDPELLAVYGRRRVGKTFLIREHLKDQIVFEVAGMHEQSTSSQLAGFHAALRRAFPNVASVQPRTWLDAFEILRTCLDQTSKSKHKRVVFFDEFPWLATRKSNFLAAFENFWNDYAALFENYQTHETIVKTLAASNSGLKFSDKPFTITKSYAESLARKIRVFRERSGRHQTLFLTIITPYGVAPNRYSEQLVTKQVTLSDLFGSEKSMP